MIREINVEKYERWLEVHLSDSPEETLERIARVWKAEDKFPDWDSTRVFETIGQELANANIGFYEDEEEKKEMIEEVLDSVYNEEGEEITREEAEEIVSEVILQAYGNSFFYMT